MTTLGTRGWRGILGIDDKVSYKRLLQSISYTTRDDFVRWSVKLEREIGLLSQQQYEEMHAQLAVNFPTFNFVGCNLDAYFEALSKDKKNIGNNLGCILTEGPGRLVRQQIPLDDALTGR